MREQKSRDHLDSESEKGKIHFTLPFLSCTLLSREHRINGYKHKVLRLQNGQQAVNMVITMTQLKLHKSYLNLTGRRLGRVDLLRPLA